MTENRAHFQLGPTLIARLSWSVRTIAFVHKWRRRALGLPTDHLTEAAPVVLSAVEQLDDQAAQTLLDLYQLTNQLPAPGDILLVGPLEVRVEDRRLEVPRPSDCEQVVLTYCLEIERYRYEPLPGAVTPAAFSTSTVQPV